MIKLSSLRYLSVIFFLSGVWDVFLGLYFTFMVGTGRLIDFPAIDPFYSLFIASFFFSFGYLQFMSAFNIRRYALNIGIVTFGRFLYIILLCVYGFSGFDLPMGFWFGGTIDSLFIILYISLTILSDEIHLRDLFLPKRSNN